MVVAPLNPSHPYAKNLETFRVMLYEELEKWAPGRRFTLGDFNKELRRRSQEKTLRIDGAQTIKQKLNELCESGILQYRGGMYYMQ